VAAGNRRAARAPFVLLVVALLASGLISLLLLNASVNQGAFQLSKLKKQTNTYTDEEQALQQQVDRDSAPGPLAARARQLGMVPGGSPVFLSSGGKVHGTPGQATAPPVPPPATAPATPPSGHAPLATIDPATQAQTGGDATSPSPTTGR
jgi:cell division protein FtsB